MTPILLLFAALSAQVSDSFGVPVQPAVVIQWLTANRDTLIQCGGAQVLARWTDAATGTTMAHVRRDGIDVQLAESVQHVDATSIRYRVRLAAASRKLRSWSTDVSVQPCEGGTWISISLSASVYGPGERRVGDEVAFALAKVKAYLRAVFK